MANRFVFENNAITTLASSILAGATTCTLSVGSGSEFPSPTAGQQFAITFLDAATGTINEIAYCTSRTGDVLTIVRGREGTTAAAWPAGTTVSNFITRDALASFVQFASSTNYWAAGGSANALIVTPTPAYDAYFTGLTIDVGVASNNTGAATLNVNGLGAQAIRDQNGVALTADMLVAGRIMRVVYVAAGYFKLVAAPPPASFIKTLPAAAAISGTDIVPISQSGLAVGALASNVAAFVAGDAFTDAFFLGMM